MTEIIIEVGSIQATEEQNTVKGGNKTNKSKV